MISALGDYTIIYMNSLYFSLSAKVKFFGVLIASCLLLFLIQAATERVLANYLFNVTSNLSAQQLFSETNQQQKMYAEKMGTYNLMINVIRLLYLVTIFIGSFLVIRIVPKKKNYLLGLYLVLIMFISTTFLLSREYYYYQANRKENIKAEISSNSLRIQEENYKKRQLSTLLNLPINAAGFSLSGLLALAVNNLIRNNQRENKEKNT